MLVSTPDLLIVGAGPSGLATAIGLAQQWVDFRIVDAHLEGHCQTKCIVRGIYALFGQSGDTESARPPRSTLCLLEKAKSAAADWAASSGEARPSAFGLTTPLVAQSGGWLTLESEPGEGTVVELWLPTASGEILGGVRTDTKQDAEEPSRKLVILAVDVDGLVLTNTAALLEDLGHEVLRAGSEIEALQVFRDQPALDLVVTDQVMPNMTGVQLTERLRFLRPDLPIIIATGYAEIPPGHGRDVPRLSKPFTQAELAAAVDEAVATLATA